MFNCAELCIYLISQFILYFVYIIETWKPKHKSEARKSNKLIACNAFILIYIKIILAFGLKKSADPCFKRNAQWQTYPVASLGKAR